jgi:acyl-CoA thioester hydrolase
MLTQHETEIRVRYQETDQMGFLHHANYLTYFEIGRTELLRAAGGSYRRMEEEGLFIVVVRARCHYHRPARYDDLLTIRTTVTAVKMAKLEHEYHVFRNGELLAVGHTTLAIVNDQGEVQRIPDWMREH